MKDSNPVACLIPEFKDRLEASFSNSLARAALKLSPELTIHVRWVKADQSSDLLVGFPEESGLPWIEFLNMAIISAV